MTQPAHGWRSHYALLMLLFVYTMSFIDRQIMGILVQPIKLEFGVSDTAMGVLTGLAFSLFYSVLAIPFGRYADRANRRNFVTYCCAAWSVMTALCGLVTGFWSLAGACFLLGMLAFIWTLKPYAARHFTLASAPRPAALLAATAP